MHLFKSSLAKVVRLLIGKKRLFILLLIILLLGSGATGVMFAYEYGATLQTEVANLKTSNIHLGEQLSQLRSDLATANKQAADTKSSYDADLKTQQDKITALEAKVAELEKKVANRLPAPTPAAPKKSVYDRIVSDNAEAKSKIIAALQLIEAKTPSYFTIIKNQVTEIKLVTTIGCGGGVQQQRTISISYLSADCLASTPVSTFASVIVHEGYHVYNVYVNKVYASGKQQELPSLYAQRGTFDALGVIPSFRNYIESLITYYESQ